MFNGAGPWSQAAALSPALLSSGGFPAGGQIIGNPGIVSSTLAVVSTAATFTAMPFFTPVALPIDRIGVYVSATGAASKCRVGAYTNVAGAPSSLLVEGAAEIDPSAGTGLLLATVAATLPAGFCWLCVANKDTATPATFLRCTGMTPSYTPVLATQLAIPQLPRYLGAALAYPGAMPASAPAVTVNAVNGIDGIMTFVRTV